MPIRDEEIIHRCFELALKAQGETSPNPMVGAVLVKDGQIISEGFHQQSGSGHAELNAINEAPTSLEGTTLYCNLEPCCHTNKKTPPCAQRIIQEGITKVVISNLDPNPQVSGLGVKMLQEAGIEVITDVLREEGEELNEVFFKNMRENKPFIHLKIAQTLDGKIASSTGNSQWITSEESRQKVHLLRKTYDAILTGAQTIRSDNPALTVRLDGKTEAKKRIILTRSAQLPLEAQVFTDEFSHLTFVAIDEAYTNEIEKLKSQGRQVITFNKTLESLSQKLFSLGICSVLVEAGQKVVTSFIEEKIYDRISFFVAPKILGSGLESIGDLGFSQINESILLTNIQTKNIGSDFYISGKRRELCLQD